MAKKNEKLRGDKIRDLILLIYLNEKYGGSKVRLPTLRKTLGYSQSGIYSALDESGYFERKGDVITLSEKGQSYVKKQWIPYYSAFNPFGYFLILVGFLLFLSWYLRVYHGALLIFDWYQGIIVIIGGLIIRFALLRMLFWTLKLEKKL